MKLLSAKKILGISIVLLLVLSACGEDDEGDENNAQTSWSGANSHNFGRDCTSCHKSGGSGESTFTVAGSVYNSSGGADTTGTVSILVHTAASGGGSLVKELAVDSSGNFYTTEAVTVSGAYLGFKSKNTGTTPRYMTTQGSSGACTSCHVDGGATSKLSF